MICDEFNFTHSTFSMRAQANAARQMSAPKTVQLLMVIALLA